MGGLISLDDIIAAAVEVRSDLAGDKVLTVHLYVDKGWGMTRIARHQGINRSTVYRRLDAAGVYHGPGKAGAPTKTHCKRNHDLSVHGRRMKAGGRCCAECKRMRGRGEVMD